jgi:predicted tellurium resistance membrane protein TerC
MKLVLKILFIVFILWIGVGIYLVNTEHEKAQIVMGLAVLYFSFIVMPIFIYHRYKDGKYKKYVLNDRTLLGKMNEENKKK